MNEDTHGDAKADDDPLNETSVPPPISPDPALVGLIVSVIALEYTQFLLAYPISNLFAALPYGEGNSVYGMLALGLVRMLQIACMYVVATRLRTALLPPFKPTFSLNLLAGGSAILYALVFLGLIVQAKQGETEGMQRLALLLTIQTIIGPLAEELFFRGVLYAAMRSRFGGVFSAVTTSLLFAAAHLLGEMPMEWLVVPFAGSLGMSFIYEKGKSLPLCAMLHMVFNLTAIVVSA
jgi:CAAX protease family protein